MTEAITVRRATLSDLPYLYEICLKTGDAGTDASAFFSDPYLIGHYYIAPYLFYPHGICFAAEYEYRPHGYIAAAPDTPAFRQWMEECWLPPLRQRFPRPFPQCRSEKEEKIIDLIHASKYPVDMIAQPWLADFPGHLHIDLLPGIRRKGVGNILTNNLFTELKKQNVSGLHLNVDASNTGAIGFYQKMGLHVLKEQEWGFTMGISFSANQ